jgi:predicted nucleotidyltransferase
MAKEPITGWIHEPLAAALGTRAKVTVLRILWKAATPLPYREVVRRSGMAYGSIALALNELTAIGLVEESDGGRERRVRLWTGHRLAATIASLLQVESDFFPALRIELRNAAQPSIADGLLTAAIIGPVARREERLDSDLELLVIARDPAAMTRCLKRLEAARNVCETRFGVRLRLMSYDLATARAMWRTRTAAAAQLVREAELLVGVPLEELLSVAE